MRFDVQPNKIQEVEGETNSNTRRDRIFRAIRLVSPLVEVHLSRDRGGYINSSLYV